MDHDQLLSHIKTEVQQAKTEILLHFDQYQHRVTKTVTDLGWLKKITIAIVLAISGLAIHYIQSDIASANNKSEEIRK